MTWNKIGQIVGPKGDKGDTGDAGGKGDKGDKGDTGDAGPPALIVSSVATTGDLPGTGEAGKYYIVQADGNLYGWSA